MTPDIILAAKSFAAKAITTPPKPIPVIKAFTSSPQIFATCIIAKAIIKYFIPLAIIGINTVLTFISYLSVALNKKSSELLVMLINPLANNTIIDVPNNLLIILLIFHPSDEFSILINMYTPITINAIFIGFSNALNIFLALLIFKALNIPSNIFIIYLANMFLRNINNTNIPTPIAIDFHTSKNLLFNIICTYLFVNIST